MTHEAPCHAGHLVIRGKPGKPSQSNTLINVNSILATDLALRHNIVLTTFMAPYKVECQLDEDGVALINFGQPPANALTPPSRPALLVFHAGFLVD